MIGKSKYNFHNQRLVEHDLCQSVLRDFPPYERIYIRDLDSLMYKFA